VSVKWFWPFSNSRSLKIASLDSFSRETLLEFAEKVPKACWAPCASVGRRGRLAVGNLVVLALIFVELIADLTQLDLATIHKTAKIPEFLDYLLE